MKVWIITGHDSVHNNSWVVSVWSNFDLARNAMSILRKNQNPIAEYPTRFSIIGPRYIDSPFHSGGRS